MADNEIILECPICGQNHNSPKLYVNIEKGLFNCFRCNFSGPIKNLHKYPSVMSKLQDILDSSSMIKLNASKPLDISSFDLLDALNPVREISYSDPHFHYLLNRGWTEEVISIYRPMVSTNIKYKDRIILPIFDDFGKDLIYFTARSILSDSSLKYINAKVSKSNIIFKSKLQENRLYPTIGVICEGIFDSCLIPNAIGLLGKSLSKENEANILSFLQGKSKIYVCLDKGAETNIEKICQKLYTWAPNKLIYFINTEAYGEKDLGDLSKEMSPHQLLQFIIVNSIQYKSETLTSGLKTRLNLLNQCR